jgi:hypothetical protein
MKTLTQQSFPRHQGHAEDDCVGRGDLAQHGGKIAPAARDREHRAAVLRIVVLQRADQETRERLDAAFFLARRQQEQATRRHPPGDRRRGAGANRIRVELDIHVAPKFTRAALTNRVTRHAAALTDRRRGPYA